MSALGGRHTELGFDLRLCSQQKEKGETVHVVIASPRTALRSYTSRQSPQGFDGWHRHHGVIGYYYTLHWINGNVGSYLLPALFSFCPPLPAFQQYFITDCNRREKIGWSRCICAAVDFTSTFKMCYFLSFVCVCVCVLCSWMWEHGG